MVSFTRTGSWTGSRALRIGKLEIHLFRAPRNKPIGFVWAYTVSIHCWRLHMLLTFEPEDPAR